MRQRALEFVWLTVIGSMTACASGGAPLSQVSVPQEVDVATASSSIRSAVGRADAAIAELQRTLLTRLTETMGQGGPQAAVSVCRDEAQALTKTVGSSSGLTIGRTSHRVRNAANAPRAWAADTVSTHAGRPVADAQPHVFDLGGRVGVLKPIGTQPMCLTCHGPRDSIDTSIVDSLKSAYPDDRAVDFAAGDLRGWFWAEVELP